MPEGEVRQLMAAHDFSIANMSYRVSGDGRFFEYRMLIRTNDWDNMRRLAETLRERAAIVEFASRRQATESLWKNRATVEFLMGRRG